MIIINDKVIHEGDCSDISIFNNKVVINGIEQDLPAQKNIKIEIRDCKIQDLNCTSGDIVVLGNIDGDIETTSGDINCGNIGGDVRTTSGDVTAHKITGSVKTTSGDISC